MFERPAKSAVTWSSCSFPATRSTPRITGKRRWFLGASTEWPGVVPEEDIELGNAAAAKYPEAAADIRAFLVPQEK